MMYDNCRIERERNMKIIESDCVGCVLPCIYEACPHYQVEVHYCDECGYEDTLYETDWGELCEDCLLKKFSKVGE